jgi:thioredoxin-like negative regulator of GroEL
MKYYRILLVLVSLNMAMGLSEYTYPVLEWTSAHNFGWSDSLNYPNSALVTFYEPWCPIYKAFWPKFRAAAIEVNSNLEMKSYKYKFAKFNCALDRAICKRFKVVGYPTILLISKGSIVKKFDADARTKDSIIEFLTSYFPKVNFVTRRYINSTSDPAKSIRACTYTRTLK